MKVLIIGILTRALRWRRTRLGIASAFSIFLWYLPHGHAFLHVFVFGDMIALRIYVCGSSQSVDTPADC
jgi:hypothetical protein